MNISYYWENKEERSRIAKDHTSKMYKFYSDEIYNCVSKTEIYVDKVDNPLNDVREQKIVLTDEDSVSAVFNHRDGKVCVLNFASYKHAGGAFLNGSRAQEECLCHESFLYNVLNEFNDIYYEKNLEDLNRGLYTNKALYSPDVRFFKGDKNCLADVITCAAPNYTTGYRYKTVLKEENSKVLKDRIKFILNIASNKNVDTLILGAFGCGVFGQDPYEVAKYFLDELEYHKDIENIVFAVIDKDSENYKAFKEIIKN